MPLAESSSCIVKQREKLNQLFFKRRSEIECLPCKQYGKKYCLFALCLDAVAMIMDGVSPNAVKPIPLPIMEK